MGSGNLGWGRGEEEPRYSRICRGDFGETVCLGNRLRTALPGRAVACDDHFIPGARVVCETVTAPQSFRYLLFLYLPSPYTRVRKTSAQDGLLRKIHETPRPSSCQRIITHFDCPSTIRTIAASVGNLASSYQRRLLTIAQSKMSLIHSTPTKCRCSRSRIARTNSDIPPKRSRSRHGRFRIKIRQ